MAQEGRKRILLGVTIDDSLQFLAGFPKYLTSKGWEVHVVSGPGPRLEELSAQPNVFVHSIVMSRDPSPLRDVKAAIAWIRLLRRIRPTIVSVGTPKAGLLGIVASKLTTVPHRIYFLRGLRLETTHGYRRTLFSLLELLACRSAHKVLSVSASLRRRAIELKLADPAKFLVLGNGSSNGVDTAEFDSSRFSAESREALRRALGLHSEIPVIGFVGRLTRDKGLAVLQRALELIDEDAQPYQLLIVGGIDQKGDERITRALTEGSRHVVVVPKVSRPAIYYSVIDLFCLPTLREGFPNVVLEAAASSCAVITTNATGAVDSVRDGQTGLIAKVGDHCSLAEKISTALQDEAFRHRLGSSARDTVVEHFDRQAFWKLHEEFYSGLLE